MESYKGVCVKSANIVKLEKRDGPRNTWIRSSHELLKRKDLTANAKLVYTHMLDKYVFFSSQDKQYYENMQDIGEALGGMAKQTVSDCIKKLKELELIIVTTKKVYATGKSIVSNSYIVKDVYGIYGANKVKPAQALERDSPF